MDVGQYLTVMPSGLRKMPNKRRQLSSQVPNNVDEVSRLSLACQRACQVHASMQGLAYTVLKHILRDIKTMHIDLFCPG